MRAKFFSWRKNAQKLEKKLKKFRQIFFFMNFFNRSSFIINLISLILGFMNFFIDFVSAELKIWVKILLKSAKFSLIFFDYFYFCVESCQFWPHFRAKCPIMLYLDYTRILQNSFCKRLIIIQKGKKRLLNHMSFK